MRARRPRHRGAEPCRLDLTPNPVICKNCVRRAGKELFAAEDRPPLGPPAQTPDAPAVSGPETKPEPAPSADEDRLAALEHGLADLAALITSDRRLAAMTDAERAEFDQAYEASRLAIEVGEKV